MALIIRICSVAVAASLIASPALAKREAPSAISAYVEGRAAESLGDPVSAALAYSVALSANPNDAGVAFRTYRQAINAGNRALALRAARSLEIAGALTADARLLLFLDAVQRSDWSASRTILDGVEEQGSFDFTVPTLRAWVAFAARDPAPMATLELRVSSSLAATYSREHRALLLIALKQFDEGVAAVKVLAGTDDRGRSLRLAAAAKLVALGERERALGLLTGDDSTIAAARALVSAGKFLPGAVDTINEASGLLFARIANDLQRDRASPASLTLARLASFAAPKRDEVTIILARSLAASGAHAGALAQLDRVPPKTILARSVREERISILVSAGRTPDALAIAQAASGAPTATYFDHARLGDVLMRLDRFADAANAYDRSITAAGDAAPWGLWLRYGGALDQAKDWARAKPALQKAAALAPDQPSVLNHLGYAMLEYDDDPVAALLLLTKASAASPDDAQITDSLGWALFKQGRVEQAIAALERAVAAEPGEAAISDHLGDAYWAAGRMVDARYAWAAALVQADDKDSTRIAAKIADGK